MYDEKIFRIYEAQDVSDNIGIKSMDPDNYTDIKDEIKSMIEKTIEAGGGEYKSFINSFIQNPEDVKVDGFDSDIYEFYLNSEILMKY
jgi:hypothetical protein